VAGQKKTVMQGIKLDVACSQRKRVIEDVDRWEMGLPVGILLRG